MRTVVISAAVAVCLPMVALAGDLCDDLWFVRNDIFDQNGYCFGSALGQSVFDNGDCTTKSPSLTALEKQKVAAAKELERNFGCAVNTSRRSLDVQNLNARRMLEVQPMAEGLESACIGYLGVPVPLFAGHSTASGILGYIQPGDTIGSAHFTFEQGQSQSWYFAEILTDPGGPEGAVGWTNALEAWDQCSQIAG